MARGLELAQVDPADPEGTNPAYTAAFDEDGYYRIGDAGFLLGMFVLYVMVGTLDMDRINAAFAGVAETGTILILENEGNARLSTTVPRIHVAIMGIERIVESFLDDPGGLLRMEGAGAR